MIRFLAIAAVSCLAFAARAEPAPDSEEQAVLDIRAVYDDPGTRPSHVTPALPGSFGELAEPHLIALHQAHERFRKISDQDNQLGHEVLAGTRPISDLPEIWRNTYEVNREHVHGLLLATHASTGRLPRPLTLFGLFSKEKQPDDFIDAQFAVQLASIEVLRDVSEHQPGALALCLDELALSRDISRGTLIGQMIATAMAKIASAPCMLALRASTSSERATFRSSLATIRAGWTPMATTFRQEGVFFDLVMIDHMSDASQAQIPEDARLYFPSTENGPWSKTWSASLRGSLFGSWARRAQIRKLRELERATTLAPRESDEVAEKISLDVPLALELLSSDNDTPSNWTGFIRRFRTGQARLVMLDAVAAVLDAHDRLGHWPANWADVGMVAPIDPRTALPIALVPFTGGVRLVPQLDAPRTDDDLSVTLN